MSYSFILFLTLFHTDTVDTMYIVPGFQDYESCYGAGMSLISKIKMKTSPFRKLNEKHFFECHSVKKLTKG